LATLAPEVRSQNTWGKEGRYFRGKAGRGGVSGKGKETYIRGKEREVYQGKGRGRISGVKKARNIRGKEGEVYQGKGRGRISGVKKARNIRGKKGRCIREREGDECQE